MGSKEAAAAHMNRGADVMLRCICLGRRWRPYFLRYTLKAMAKDFLEEIIAERTRQNPEFRQRVAEAELRRKIARKLVPACSAARSQAR